jgi:hypothetical protein
VKIEEGWALTAYDGTLLLDPEAADLVKLTVRTAELPTSSTACQATTEIMYGRTPIHDRLVLVPHETRLSTISRTGIETISQTNFANCREYTSTVRLILDTPQSTAVPSAMPSATAELPAPVPAGLRFDARIVTPIDSDTAAAGDPVEAVLRSSLHGKNKTVVAPAGSRMHGRLTNVSWQPGRVWNYKITVRFDSLEMGGRSVPFSAILEPPHPAVFTGTTISRTMLAQPEAGSPGGTFFFHQEHLRLEQLDASWVTLAPDTVMEKK